MISAMGLAGRALVVLSLLLVLIAGASGGERIRVVDGDTLRIGEERIRIVGLDAPELHARCREERRIAARARERLASLLEAGPISIKRMRRRDRYGRTLAIVHAGGVDVANALISEGLARAYDGGRRKGWCGYPVPRRHP